MRKTTITLMMLTSNNSTAVSMVPVRSTSTVTADDGCNVPFGHTPNQEVNEYHEILRTLHA